MCGDRGKGDTMIYRPVDESGDILPVRSSGDLLQGAQAAAQLVRDRLSLYTGDWWENPAWGNEIPEMLEEGRLTEADQQVLASYLTAYIRETPGVGEVREVSFSAENKKFRFQCAVRTESGTEIISWEL